MESSTREGVRYLDLPYRIILTREKRKGSNAWLALVEELPGCEARGETAEDATHALQDEMAAWIADALNAGRRIPRPRHAPRTPDGKLSLKIPQSLHEAITHTAVRERLTVDQLVTIALAGVIRWRPGADETNARWIQARADSLVRGDSQGRAGGLNRALMLNAALLALVVLVAVVILIVAVAHGF